MPAVSELHCAWGDEEGQTKAGDHGFSLELHVSTRGIAGATLLVTMKLSLGLARVILIAGVASITAGCGQAGDGPADEGGLQGGANAKGPKLCVALRGNGPSVITHFVSLARIVEHYGVVDGIAGGSSGSLTTFVYESILANPAISRCGTTECSETERAARVSLALKSIQGYGMTVASSEEGAAIGDLAGTAAKLKKEVEERGIGALVSKDAALAAQQLEAVLEIPEVRTLVNPESFAMLRDTAHLEYNVKEIHTSIVSLGSFSVDDNRLFFRPGILSWDSLSLLFGRVADFYAGSGGADQSEAQTAWLDACADASVGKPWEEATALPTPSGATCGEAFGKVASDYRAKVRAGNQPPARLSERIGAPAPLRKIVTTSVLEGDAVPAYARARAAYLSGEHVEGSVPFDVSFDDVKFGYWGAEEDLAALAADTERFGDLKTRKMTSLGDATWKEILTRSPAEPGLSRLVELPDGRISAGGWSDLAPTLALKNLDCERVVYVTREGDESGFATKIAKNLGMSEADWQKLYDLNEPASSYNVSLQEADAVWCTNWNSFSDVQQREMAVDAWSAPLETRPGFEGIRTLAPYPNTTERTGKPGCTPGVSAGATYPR